MLTLFNSSHKTKTTDDEIIIRCKRIQNTIRYNTFINHLIEFFDNESSKMFIFYFNNMFIISFFILLMIVLKQ